MSDCAANVIDELILNEILAVPDRIEDLTYSERGRGVLANEAEGLLVLHGGRIFDPEGAIGFEILPKTSSLNGFKAMVHVVEKVDIVANGLARSFEELGDKRKIPNSNNV